MNAGSTGKREGDDRYRSGKGVPGGEQPGQKGKGFVSDTCGTSQYPRGDTYEVCALGGRAETNSGTFTTL